jgi:hypothetical protein
MFEVLAECDKQEERKQRLDNRQSTARFQLPISLAQESVRIRQISVISGLLFELNAPHYRRIDHG